MIVVYQRKGVVAVVGGGEVLLERKALSVWRKVFRDKSVKTTSEPRPRESKWLLWVCCWKENRDPYARSLTKRKRDGAEPTKRRSLAFGKQASE